MRVLIINYGMGNLGSVSRAFEECGAHVLISSDPEQLQQADRIVLPGVGAFGDGMEHLEKKGWPEAIRKTLKNPHVAFLGICLGMQLLADRGTEGGEIQGLGLISGEVIRLQAKKKEERIPHIGWNEIKTSGHSHLLNHIPDGTDFYFVHSYHFVPKNPKHAIAKTPYAGEFVSVVASENIYGAQFHPEKSSRAGFRLIRNFLDHNLC